MYLKRSILLVLCVAAVAFARAVRDPRIPRVAEVLQAGDLAALYDLVSASDHTRSLMAGLSESDRRHLARVLHKAKKWTIRDGHLEQYRMFWRSRDLPESEFIISFQMNARPGDLTKPMIAFSSDVKRIPRLLADALFENRIPLAASFYDPSSRWVDEVKKLSHPVRFNLVHYYRAAKLQQAQEDEQIYVGEYIDASGIKRQLETRIKRTYEGRWVIE